MTNSDPCEPYLTNPEPFRQWMTVHYKLFNLSEIEKLCEIPVNSIYNDLGGHLKMSSAQWYLICSELHDIFTDMPSWPVHAEKPFARENVEDASMSR